MPLTEDQRTKLASVAVSDISDTMERLSMGRTVLSGFACSVGSGGTVVGPAFTIRQAPKHAPAKASERLTRHGEVSASLAAPGDFVVVDAGGRTDIASWGGHHSGRCHQRGVSGVLINGGTRDIAEIRRIGFPTFYLATSPISSRWDQETVEINGPVTVGSVQIRAGDILVADEDGLIVIAPDQVAAVIGGLK